MSLILRQAGWPRKKSSHGIGWSTRGQAETSEASSGLSSEFNTATSISFHWPKRITWLNSLLRCREIYSTPWVEGTSKSQQRVGIEREREMKCWGHYYNLLQRRRPMTMTVPWVSGTTQLSANMVALMKATTTWLCESLDIPPNSSNFGSTSLARHPSGCHLLFSFLFDCCYSV